MVTVQPEHQTHPYTSLLGLCCDVCVWEWGEWDRCNTFCQLSLLTCIPPPQYTAFIHDGKVIISEWMLYTLLLFRSTPQGKPLFQPALKLYVNYDFTFQKKVKFTKNIFWHLHSFGDVLNKQACCAGCRRRTSPNEAPPIGKIHPFRKMAITFEPLMVFWCPLGFRKFFITMTQSISESEERQSIPIMEGPE